MDFEIALRLAALFVGSFLHGVLVFGVLRGPRRRRSERVLRLFFLAVLLWHAGSFLALALSGVEEAYTSLARRLANTVAFAGLAFLPSLLLHAVLSEGWRRSRPTPGPASAGLGEGHPPPGGERLVAAAAYLPLIGLPWPLWRVLRPPEQAPLEALASLVAPWIVWFAVILLVAAGLSLRIGRMTSPADRRLDVRLALSLVLAAIGLVYAYLLGGRDGRWGYTVETLVMTSSILPTLVFTYHVYRYRVLGYVVRDSAVSVVASASFVALYLFVLRETARRAQGLLGVPAALLEGALLVVLILLFEPYGDSLRALARRYFGGGRERLRRQAALAAERLTHALSADQIASILGDTLQGGEAVDRILLLVAAEVPLGSPLVGRLDAACPALALELAAGRDAARRDAPPSAAVLGELERLDVHAALALRTRDRLHGALLVRGQARRGLYPEDLEDLQVAAQGAALALEAATLLAEKLSAERKAGQAEKMASLGWLAAGVAHEVKNPLSSIKAVAQVLQRDAGQAHAWRQDLDLIVREVDRLDGAVDRLLLTARPGRREEGGSSPARATDIGQALDRLAIALGPQAQARGVSFEFRLGRGAARVRATPEELWEVFYNLAVNALDAMPRGGVFRVEQLGLEPGPAPAGLEDGTLRLRVSDSGAGLAPGVGRRVFDPFFTTKDHGHGLGLAIVERRLRAVGGSIKLAVPAPGAAGAVFDLAIPLAPPAGGGAAGEAAPADVV